MLMEGVKLDLAVGINNRFPKTMGIPTPTIQYVCINNRYSKERRK